MNNDLQGDDDDDDKVNCLSLFNTPHQQMFADVYLCDDLSLESHSSFGRKQTSTAALERCS